MAIFKFSRATTAIAGATLLVLGASAAAWTAGAQGAAKRSANKHDPIAITADDQKAFDDQRMIVETGNVEALQGERRLHADVVHIYYKPKDPNAPPKREGGQPGSGWGDPDHMIADGHVYLVMPDQIVTGDHAEYNYDADTVVVTGHVIAKKDQDVSKGDRLTVNNATGESHMDSQASKGRVTAVIFPKSSGAAQTDPAKKPQ